MIRKRFGQHFLHDPAVIDRIVKLIDPQPDDTLIEIGPGQGALTQPLLQRAGQLIALEIDRDLAAELRDRYRGIDSFNLLQTDALKADYAALAADQPLRLVGNLPYNISTPLLFHLLTSRAAILDMHFMLQKEVVERLTAAPGGRNYGRLSVTAHAYAQAEALFDVGRGAFNPPPQVTSTVVRITPRPPPFPLRSQATYQRLVTQAFSQRRKTLRNALSGLVDERLFKDTGIDPGLRPERLSPAQFAELANRVAERSGDYCA